MELLLSEADQAVHEDPLLRRSWPGVQFENVTFSTSNRSAADTLPCFGNQYATPAIVRSLRPSGETIAVALAVPPGFMWS